MTRGSSTLIHFSLPTYMATCYHMNPPWLAVSVHVTSDDYYPSCFYEWLALSFSFFLDHICMEVVVVIVSTTTTTTTTTTRRTLCTSSALAWLACILPACLLALLCSALLCFDRMSLWGPVSSTHRSATGGVFQKVGVCCVASLQFPCDRRALA